MLRITGGNRMYLVDDYSMSGDWWQVKYQRIEPLGQILSFTVRAPARGTEPSPRPTRALPCRRWT